MKKPKNTGTEQERNAIRKLREIPGVGPVIARDLFNLGFRTPEGLRARDPEALYDLHNQQRGAVQDRCMLYVLRCAVYYANTIGKQRDPEKLNWWYWKD